MDPQAVLAILLACAGSPETPAQEGGDLSQVEASAETLTEWLGNGGDPWGFATYDQVNALRAIASEYANSVPAEQFSEGLPPEEVAAMVNTLAANVEPYCTE